MDRPSSSTTLFTGPYIELSNREQILRFELTQPVHRLGRDSTWADLVVPAQGWGVVSGRHIVFTKEGDHKGGAYRIQDGDGQSKPSTNGLFINHTRVTMQPGMVMHKNAQFQIGQNPQNMILLDYVVQPSVPITAHLKQTKLALRGLESTVALGREPAAVTDAVAMTLDAPSVSRYHASIQREGPRYVLRDRSTNGTYVNRHRLTHPYALQEGDIIQIGPFTLLLRNEVLEIFDRGDQLRLDALNLVRQVKYAKTQKTILGGVSLAIEPGQLVAIVGGSGAGKSTLMKTLLGIAPTTSGTVLLNGDDLRQNFDLYRAEIGYVPQDDIVHYNLTVEEVLSYACELRLPPDTDIPAAVTRTLEQVKLSHVRHTLIAQLSGGQRKRVSIAVELLANPKLFFLDEPTSGLDPGLDKKMMALLRELADQGRTIVLVTHATSNLEVCDRIVFMGSGGQLCYFGPPKEAMTFFEAPEADFKYFADIYIKLDEGDSDQERAKNVQYWAQKFKQSPDHTQYVQSVLSTANNSTQTEKPKRQKMSSWRQWLILGRRYLKLVRRDRFSLLLLFFTAPIGVLLIRLALQSKNPLAEPPSPVDPAQGPLALQVLFVFTCATIWVGLSGTAQTIVKEANIYLRERLVNLRLIPYLGSKFSIHTGLALVQTLLLVLVILLSFESPQPDLMPWSLSLLVTSFLTLLASTSLGLMISAFVSNPTQANSTLPLILIPQIVFSGTLFELEGASRIISWLMISRWSIGAYAAGLNVNQMAPEPIEGIVSIFESTAAYDATWDNLMLNWGILCVHSLVYLSISLWQQKQKDIL
ncbi:ATP-binding cassette domain-containing protein [cf. Phormidesmis sp. LEGE 11477]|uniref:ATP-binding cassette domain-containing protein n=1 Tax=cf. Phormidesmis sp. LEGE 11477 TaxID=1828680 RepID=UPI001880E480|nr:ATP-binding cassette domain-containing protein [cf. Phormidesmis sp. LEGE 11477]MBE9061279.1 ATP-binding cassette domain-containing protein [cf. Phormidesmis sp. LEGE 11477]